MPRTFFTLLLAAFLSLSHPTIAAATESTATLAIVLAKKLVSKAFFLFSVGTIIINTKSAYSANADMHHNSENDIAMYCRIAKQVANDEINDATEITAMLNQIMQHQALPTIKDYSNSIDRQVRSSDSSLIQNAYGWAQGALSLGATALSTAREHASALYADLAADGSELSRIAEKAQTEIRDRVNSICGEKIM